MALLQAHCSWERVSTTAQVISNQEDFFIIIIIICSLNIKAFKQKGHRNPPTQRQGPQ